MEVPKACLSIPYWTMRSKQRSAIPKLIAASAKRSISRFRIICTKPCPSCRDDCLGKTYTCSGAWTRTITANDGYRRIKRKDIQVCKLIGPDKQPTGCWQCAWKLVEWSGAEPMEAEWLHQHHSGTVSLHYWLSGFGAPLVRFIERVQSYGSRP